MIRKKWYIRYGMKKNKKPKKHVFYECKHVFYFTKKQQKENQVLYSILNITNNPKKF